MNFKLYELKVTLKNKSNQFLRWILKPLAYFYTTEKINARYHKSVDKITESQTIKWAAEDIIRYIIKNKSEINILICDFANDDHFWYDCTLKSAPHYIKRTKTRRGMHKFNKDIDFQLKIIEQVKSLNVVNVEEIVEEFTYERIKNYKKTVNITPKIK